MSVTTGTTGKTALVSQIDLIEGNSVGHGQVARCVGLEPSPALIAVQCCQ